MEELEDNQYIAELFDLNQMIIICLTSSIALFGFLSLTLSI